MINIVEGVYNDDEAGDDETCSRWILGLLSCVRCKELMPCVEGVSWGQAKTPEEISKLSCVQPVEIVLLPL